MYVHVEILVYSPDPQKTEESLRESRMIPAFTTIERVRKYLKFTLNDIYIYQGLGIPTDGPMLEAYLQFIRKLHQAIPLAYLTAINTSSYLICTSVDNDMTDAIVIKEANGLFKGHGVKAKPILMVSI